MSDWLERQLAGDLEKVAAPEALGVRLGFLKPRPAEFPRVALAVAATVLLIIGAGYAASQTSSLDLRKASARQLPRAVELTSIDPGAIRADGTRPVRCDRGTAAPLQTGRATILLAHASLDVPSHAPAAGDAGCRHCHTL